MDIIVYKLDEFQIKLDWIKYNKDKEEQIKTIGMYARKQISPIDHSWNHYFRPTVISTEIYEPYDLSNEFLPVNSTESWDQKQDIIEIDNDWLFKDVTGRLYLWSEILRKDEVIPPQKSNYKGKLDIMMESNKT